MTIHDHTGITVQEDSDDEGCTYIEVVLKAPPSCCMPRGFSIRLSR